MSKFDAVIVGSGPNGFSAGITLAEAGLSVLILERSDTPGGGVRTKDIFSVGTKHDICSAVHPLGIASPVFQGWKLEKYGLEWIEPDIRLAHPFEDGSAAIVASDWNRTIASLGEGGQQYQDLILPLAEAWSDIKNDILAPLHFPKNPIRFAQFGLYAGQSAAGFARRHLTGMAAKSMYLGIAAHSPSPLNKIFTNGPGLVLALAAHGEGWPIPRGGAESIIHALEKYFLELGGEVRCDSPVDSWDDLPETNAVLFDTDVRQLSRIAGDRLPGLYRKQLGNFRYGPGVFKVDYVLDSPIPFANEQCRKAGTIHLAGHYSHMIKESIELSEGKAPALPYTLLSQPTQCDPTRAPEGRHIAWAYCHVPHGSAIDMTERIESQLERFAPGFRDHILQRRTLSAAQMEEYNPNYIGGDITGGIQDWKQTFTRPAWRPDPYKTPAEGIFICSASTPPGAGVHGMCGYHAANSALRNTFNLK